MIPDILAGSITFGIALKFQITPGSIAMLVALALCIAITWRFCKRKI